MISPYVCFLLCSSRGERTADGDDHLDVKGASPHWRQGHCSLSFHQKSRIPARGHADGVPRGTDEGRGDGNETLSVHVRGRAERPPAAGVEKDGSNGGGSIGRRHQSPAAPAE